MEWTVVGHDDVKATFEGLILERSLPHAVLLSGPSAIGKRMFAEDVIRELHHTSDELGQNPDHRVLAPGISADTGKPTDIAVEDVRSVKAWAYQRPLFGAVKTVLVDDADRLGEAAANTFLKVLEEPPAYLYFFLITSLPGGMLATIASRCQEHACGILSDAHMKTVLSGLRIDDDDRELLRAVAAGRPGTALELVHNKQLPVVARSIATFEQLLKAGTAERLVAAKTLADDNLTEAVSWWLSWTHAQLPVRPRLAPVAHGLLELSSAVAEPKYSKRLALERFLLELPS